ncbi:lantibiotic dehydratase [Actinoallomurus rhizosphaericola]|uniref:lantibiotic dehydratase n=1 Tax=Actinoallomurus rhizosphaericola TaxID=2952536 RepID=UPI0020931E29|nr:lantibiotic dehydratase [Actinoallomurus rhizosphaericola]MCO5994801.1 lantibiotic dehydratase [Actinoallomurus rhizosphaericola]
MRRAPGRYRPLDAALLRATTYPSTPLPGIWPGLDDEPDLEQWCAWLTAVWSETTIADAIAIASPALAARVAAVSRGHRPRPDKVRRMMLSLSRYLVRAGGRATPFALFAGIAPVRFGPETLARCGDEHDVRVRADAVWLTGVIARLEACVELRHRLTVTVNDLVFMRGERLVVPWQPHAGDPARPIAAEMSVRANRAVEVILRTAALPIRGEDLLKELAAALPAAAASALDDVVADLIACGVLVTCLRPPSTSTDGLAHLLDQLQAVNAADVDEAAVLVHELVDVQALLQSASGPCDASETQAAVRRMRALAEVEQPLRLNVRLDCAAVLPTDVAAEAAHAADALVRLSPYPGGHPGWQDYHDRFLARYGTGAVVPLDRLIDPVAGLGYPTHYANPEHQSQAAPMSQRDQRLLALAQQAALDGAREVVLDDHLIDTLTAGEAIQPRPAPHAAMCVEVSAPTMAALAEGAFTLMVVGVGRTAAALAGRFLDLLPDEDQQRMIGVFHRLPVSVDGAIAAQLCFPPVHPRVENLTCAPRLLPDILTLAEHRAEEPGRFCLPDLAVTADPHALYLLSRSRQQIVEPLLAHAPARHALPPLARFVFELARTRHAALTPFAWGPAGCMPFLPRIRTGRTVLAPARWRIPAAALPGREAPGPVWDAALSALRERLGLPSTVSVGESDRLLRLNLDAPMDRAVLRDHLDKATKRGQTTVVSEATSAADHGWFGGRAHELVVPIASSTPSGPAPAVVNRPGPLPLVDHQDGVLPGAGVLFAKVYGHPEVFDTILTRAVPELLAGWEPAPMWWFIRYRDPRPHLRLRLHLRRVEEYGEAASRVGSWTTELRRRGLATVLVLDTYHPETARYGSGTAQTAVEALFAADSAAAVAQVQALTATRDVHPSVLTAVSMIDLTCALAGDRRTGMRWLVATRRTAPAPALDRGLVRETLRLAGPPNAPVAFHELGTLNDAWKVRRDAAVTYTERLATGGSPVTAAAVTGSLLHLHHNRARGIDPDAEQLCDRLARAAALSWVARHDTAEEQR